jgi:hypothetical protein
MKGEREGFKVTLPKDGKAGRKCEASEAEEGEIRLSES